MPVKSTLTITAAASNMSPLQKVALGSASVLFVIMFALQRFYLRVFGRSIRSIHTEDDAKVTFSLIRNFRQVGRLALPTFWCREAAGSLIFILLFAANALLKVYVSKSNGAVLATMLHGKRAGRVYRFVQAILMRAGVGMSRAICSGLIEGIRPWLIGCYRERLSRLLQRRFYERLVYYQASVLDDRLEEADTVIATYCGEFAEHFAELPYYFLLPGFECITSSYALVQQSGPRAACVMGGVVTLSVLMLRSLSPQFGRIHSLLLSREDDYRRMLTNDMNSVENIAMHDAGEYTRRRLDQSLGRLKYTLDHMALAKGNFVMLETAFTTFLTLVADTVAFSTAHRAHFRKSVNDIYLEIQLIEDLNSSVKDFVVNFRELSHLTEFTNKLAEYDTTLDSIASGTFIHNSRSLNAGVSGRSSEEDSSVEGRRHDAAATASVGSGTPVEYTTVKYSDNITVAGRPFELVKMDDVVLRSPAGTLLFSGMNISFKSNEDWVILGDNGCGKTSLLRMLSGLWLPAEGTLTLDKSVVFLLAPQHSYMAPSCTLYEQICFPRQTPEVTEKVRANIREAIRLAGAETVIDLIGGYYSPLMGLDADDRDESYDWGSLSGGQKQRISMARVFFHVVQMDRRKCTPVAILDEATSMMDDTEQDVLNNLRRLDVRMISVTHREVVIRHHTNVLRIQKGGKWKAEAVRNRVPVGSRVDVADDTV